jgi:predicted nucleotidyltransferase component of viral defense system
MQSLSPVAAREIVHLLILRELTAIRRASAITVKGGVNLRLFFGSFRYSEDMDLDGSAQAREALRDNLKGMFENSDLTRRLQALGVRELDPGEGPNKDTETTFRYKFGIVVAGGIRYPTKVEVSFRDRHPADEAMLETPQSEILRTYGMDVFAVRHYVREAAVRQKLVALGGRREAQARDVFDVHVLVPDPAPDTLVQFLAKELGASRLEEAHARALAMTYAEYEGQVIEFLSAEARPRYGTEGAWDEMRLRAAGLIESVLRLQEQK